MALHSGRYWQSGNQASTNSDMVKQANHTRVYSRNCVQGFLESSRILPIFRSGITFPLKNLCRCASHITSSMTCTSEPGDRSTSRHIYLCYALSSWHLTTGLHRRTTMQWRSKLPSQLLPTANLHEDHFYSIVQRRQHSGVDSFLKFSTMMAQTLKKRLYCCSLQAMATLPRETSLLFSLSHPYGYK